MSVVYFLVALLLLGILITAHEFGHFIFARLGGIEVKEFAIGMGPVIAARTGKNGTRYSLRAIPIGGFCAFYGEDDVDGSTQDDPRSYNRQSVWKRMLSVLMGPGMNFILALVVAIGFYAINGVPTLTGYEIMVDTVAGTGPAYSAGLKDGDKILSINNIVVEGTNAEEVISLISTWQEGDEPLQLQLSRDGETVETSMTPFWDEELSRYRIGVTLSYRGLTESQHVSLGEAVQYGANTCWYAGTTILRTLKNLVTTGEGIEDTSGPVGVISLVSSEVRDYGVEGFINLLILISINLGIMNLLPIPGLDGSRFLFMLLEAVRGKPVDPRKEAIVHLCGYALLFLLMIMLTFKDVLNLFR